MSELEVRLARLEPIRVASARGFGESPELLAWKILSSPRPMGCWTTWRTCASSDSITRIPRLEAHTTDTSNGSP